MDKTTPHTNRLIHEKSPYLLQHAHNPVDWYPWDEEALSRARKLDLPIFLSVGYSTCHWCHVMEHESFENEQIAKILNERFVPIKVDREERPDLDNLYMGAVQALTGSGGWPLSVFLTPDLQPFFGGTYFPPEDRWGRPGFGSLLIRISDAWKDNRAELAEDASRLTNVLRSIASAAPPAGEGDPLGEATLTRAFEQLSQRYDKTYGGFGQAPKFPTPHNLTFLLRYANRTGNSSAIEMIRGTLDAMAAGGIHDQLAGGFHRYSTDHQWLVPHFEKMLYDQAGLAIAYSDAWLVTKDSTYAAVTRGICEYVLEYLRDPAGGLYSAEDADSEGEEGTFYIWTAEEIVSELGDDLGEEFNAAFGVRPGGNWEGKSILNRPVGRPALSPKLENARVKLLAIRDRRPRPHRDEKIIVAWNGFMIEALAKAGRALDEPRYIEAAVDAADFIESNLWRDGRLLRYYRGGPAEALGYIDDYAFLGRGLLALYEATFDPAYLKKSIHIAQEMLRLFQRPEGGFGFTGSDADTLIVPVLDLYDGAMPSGNSSASLFLLRLGHATADEPMEGHGRSTLETFRRNLDRAPGNHLEMLAALDFALGPVTEVVLSAPTLDPGGDATVASMLEILNRRYLPNSVAVLRPESGAESVTDLIPYTESQGMIGGRPTAYVCRDYACKLPVHDAESFGRQLDEED